MTKSYEELDLTWDNCPCAGGLLGHRRLDDKEEDAPTWEAVYTGLVLLAMFAMLLTDRFGADSCLMLALTMLLVAEIVTPKEALSGFANEGLWTVVILFIVAGGISATGALDWYLGKILGSPKSSIEAQLRLMLPVTVVSAFMNNTPLVAIMIPIVTSWSKKINIAPQQLFIPLTYGSELGGTCTVIGTSTNLIVTGLMAEKYEGDPSADIGLFSVGQYGVPIAIAGIVYIVLAAPYLLPESTRGKAEDDEDILLRAKVTPWSPAANRTVRRSGLRDTGGIFLVSVERAATGNLHRAVSPDFVVNVGDVLYFTGLVESFGSFCEEHGLEIITESSKVLRDEEKEEVITEAKVLNVEELGTTLESIIEADSKACLREINHLSDLIHRIAKELPNPTGPPRIVVTADEGFYVVGIDAPDRAGLLMNISNALTGLQLQLHNTEAAVVGARSISVWRSSRTISELLGQDEIWKTVNAVVSSPTGAIVKHTGLLVIRAKVVKESSLVGKIVTNIDFKAKYAASLIAVQQNGRNAAVDLHTLKLGVGDVLVLHVERSSPLLSQKDVETDESSQGKGDEESGPEASFAKDLEVVEKNQKASDWVYGELEFLSAMVIAERSAFIGKSAVQSGLGSLTGVTLVSIERKADGEISSPGNNASDSAARSALEAVGMDEELLAGDILWYAGSASYIGDLRKIPGIVSYHEEEVKKIGDKVHERRLVQAVISSRGALVGKTVRDAKFRTHYGAVVIAVQREGKRLHAYPGQVVLQAGDVLLLEAGPSFVADKYDEGGKAFTLLMDVEDSAPPRMRLLIPALIIMAGMLGVYVAELCSLVTSALVASFFMIMLGIISEDEARKSIQWDVFVTVGSALGMGVGLVNSGLANIFADVVVDIGTSLGIGDAGLYGAVYLSTALVSNVLTNNAAAALVFPIALEAADKFGADRKLMAFTLMFGASACFASPFGYQTNLMVFVPGKYRTIDFVKLGAPMQVVMFLWSVLVLTVIDPWYLSWITAFAVLVGLIVIVFGGNSVRRMIGGAKSEP